MPIENNFHHDELSRKNPGDRLAYAEWTPPPDTGTPAWQEAMGQAGQKLSQAGVRMILFLHGSIPGTDIFGLGRLDEVGGLKRGYSRGISGLDSLLSFMREGTNGITPLPGGLTPPLANDEATRNLLDSQIGDAGNFTTAIVQQCQKALNQQLTTPIACVRELWSSEHHHLGRALAACKLLDRLRGCAGEQPVGSGGRILVLAHGQAGLVLALASNMLCPSPITGRKALFELLLAAQPQGPVAEAIRRIEPLLANGMLLNGATLDIATFGTPVRYGWDPSGIGKLLHIVNHRNLRTDGKTWLSKMDMPQITVEMPIAWGGDYVQQLAVAGSDALPQSEAAKATNKAIWELVEPYDGFERWVECARRAGRFPSEGQCLLVDYKDCTSSTNVRDHYYGHAAYTRTNAMLFNFNQIISRLYS